MNFSFLHQRSGRLLLSMMLLICIMLTSAIDTRAEIDPIGLKYHNVPTVPRLSLTGAQLGYNKDWYPDAMIRMVPSDNAATYQEAREMGREFLMPVFIDNKWTKYPGDMGDKYVPEEIHSLEFKIQYDSTVMRAIGIQKVHPSIASPDDNRFLNSDGSYYEPLGKDFHFEMHDYKDTSYRWMIYGDETNADKDAGRTIKIVASSDKPLPPCNLDGDDFRILCYVKFRVVTIGGLATPKAVYVSNDTIKINDMNICMDAPFWKYRNLPGYEDWATYYEDPNGSNNPRLFNQTLGLAGLSNYDFNPNVRENWTTYANNTLRLYRPGVIWAMFSQRSPEIEFNVPDTFMSEPIAQDQENPEYYTLIEPITVDYKSNRDNPATRDVFLLNKLDGSRIIDLEIESDQKWLKFNTVPGNTNANWLPAPTDKGLIPMIDKGLLGPFNEPDPMDNDTDDDGDVQLRISCDPLLLDAQAREERPGMYVGYLTFKSKYMKVSPIRLKVTFIYFKTPMEWNNSSRNPGIEIIVQNSRGITPDNPDGTPQETNLIFGTGYRATRSVDTIYGEHAYQYEMGEFDARWFPPTPWGWTPAESPEEIAEDPKIEVELHNLELNGYGDWAPNAWNPRSNSRDIRDTTAGQTSLIYWCKFNPGIANDYPVKVMWDVTDFPDGAHLFIRDAVNGTFFNKNMRDATLIDGEKYSYTIQDPNIKSFLIEYTPARVLRFVDVDGKPIIKKGWNFLSMPVRPVNNYYKVYFPNALNIPIYFPQSLYQDEPNLRPGVGYFVKYSDVVDEQFAGAPVNVISEATGDPVRMYPGWNTIGALYSVTSVENINFTPFGEQDLPTPGTKFTKKYGVWGYTTDNGYKEVYDLQPGLGYWIKVGILGDEVQSEKAHGMLKLTPVTGRISNGEKANEKYEVIENSANIIVRDNAQHEANLYMTNADNEAIKFFELPPLPPTGLFDTRFADNKLVSNEDNSVIMLQGVTYPLSLSVKNADADYTFYDAVTNEVLGTITKGSNKNIEIEYLAQNAVVVKKSDAQDNFIACFPNPVVDNAKINFEVQTEGKVSVKLFDIVGNEIMTLVNAEYATGNFNTDLDASSLTNGTYIVKIVSGGKTAIHTITVMK